MDGEKIEKMCELVRQHPHLYNSKLKQYKDLQMCINSWRVIALGVGAEESVCKQRWKYMRDQFVKAKKKLDARRSGAEATNVCVPAIITRLSWLNEFVKHRETDSNFPEAEHSVVPCTESTEAGLQDGSTPPTTCSTPSPPSLDKSTPPLETSTPSPPPSPSHASSRSCTSRKRKRTTTPSKDVIPKKMALLDGEPVKDSAYFFGMMVAENMRKLPPSVHIQCRNDMLEVLSRYHWQYKGRQRKNKTQKTKTKSRKWCMRPLNENRVRDGEFSTLVQEMRLMDQEKHHQYFRMSVDKFDFLTRRISERISHQSTHQCPITVAERLAVTLRYLAAGSTQGSIAASYKIASCTVSQIIPEVCKAIWDTLQPQFVPVPSEAQWRDIALDYARFWNFPLCLGAVDGRHITKALTKTSRDSSNHKGSQSLVLMAACDAHYRFTMVDVGAYGRESDGGIFEESVFGSMLLNGTMALPGPTTLPGTDVTNPHVFVGDAAFPLHPNLMCPFPGSKLTTAQQVYNYRHSRARRIMENAFGIMASRWRIFGRPIDCRPDNVVHIVKACLALHNYLIHTDAADPGNIRYVPSSFTDSTTTNGDVLPGEWRQHVAGDKNLLAPSWLSAARATRDALHTRHNFMTYFQTPAGLVPWQDTVVRRGLLTI